MDVSQVVEHITKGEATSKARHNTGISGVSEAQAKEIADYIKNLKFARKGVSGKSMATTVLICWVSFTRDGDASHATVPASEPTTH
jgi:hypothetical protein